MNTRRILFVFLAAMILLASAARMPAPITVPPEEAPQTKVVPPEEAPKKKKKEEPKPAAAKPAPPKTRQYAPGSMNGNWMQTDYVPDGSTPSGGPRWDQITVTVSQDERSLTMKYQYYAKSAGKMVRTNDQSNSSTYPCSRTGNTLRVHNQVYDNMFYVVTMQLAPDGSASFMHGTEYDGKPPIGVSSFKLKRE